MPPLTHFSPISPKAAVDVVFEFAGAIRRASVEWFHASLDARRQKRASLCLLDQNPRQQVVRQVGAADEAILDSFHQRLNLPRFCGHIR